MVPLSMCMREASNKREYSYSTDFACQSSRAGGHLVGGGVFVLLHIVWQAPTIRAERRQWCKL